MDRGERGLSDGASFIGFGELKCLKGIPPDALAFHSGTFLSIVLERRVSWSLGSCR